MWKTKVITRRIILKLIIISFKITWWDWRGKIINKLLSEYLKIFKINLKLRNVRIINLIKCIYT